MIDSCINPVSKEPIALDYLNGLGVDVSTQVIGILITHWHSDHIRGATKLLKACERAKLYISSAISSNEALHLAALYKTDIFAQSDKEIREFKGIIDHLFNENDQSRLETVNAKHTLFDNRSGIPSRMVALSPSNTAVTNAIAELVNITPNKNTDRVRNIIPMSENLNAVAIHFSFGEFSAVLGADLEETGNPLTGWSAIFNSNIQQDLSLAKGTLFKVAHHGSNNGEHVRIWTDLLGYDPVSIATPYTRSGLPTKANINRIKRHSTDFYVTRDPDKNKKIKRDKMVDREMKAITTSRKVINDKIGHIQIRVDANANISVRRCVNVMKY